METRANYLAIGLFTLLVFAMAFGLIYWLVRFNETGAARMVDLVVPGNAGGLQKGNGVLFNGLRIGSVVSVEWRKDDPAHVYAKLKIDAGAPIREDTTVTIASQPLTGLSTVSLVGGSPEKDLILERETVPVLVARPSQLNETLEAAGKTVQIANATLLRINKLVETNLPSINRTIANAEAFSSSLATNTDDISALMDNIGKASLSIAKLGDTLDSISGNVTDIVKAVEPEKVRSTLANVEKISGDIARNSGEIDGIVGDAKAAVQNFSGLTAGLNTTVSAINGEQLARMLSNVETFSGQLTGTLTKVDGILNAVDQERINRVLTSVEGFASRLDKSGSEIDAIIANAKSATEDVTGFTKTLSENKENFDKIIKDATVISERLIKTSEAVTRLVGRVDGLVEGNGRGLVQEATDAAKSIRRVAESFEARADSISSGLDRFSNRGLKDIEALISQSRDAVSRLENIIGNIDENPAQFLLGGSKVPEYRQRR